MRQEVTSSLQNYVPQRAFFSFNGYSNLFPFFLGSLLLPMCAFPFLPGWDTSKWVLLYILSAASFLSVPRQMQFELPKFSGFQKYVLSSLILLVGFNYFYHKVSFFEKESLDRILFWGMFFYYSFVLKPIQASEKKYLYAPLFVGTGIFLICAFLNFIFVDQFLSFTFRNINKSAEYIGFSVALQIAFLPQYQGKAKKILMLLIAACLAYIYFTKCRSASLGIICVLAYVTWSRTISLRSLLQILLGATLFIGFFEIIFLKLGAYPTDLSHKWGSAVERWHLVLNTLSLIRDFPLGVGLGKYGIAAIPYMTDLPDGAFNEGYYLFSPYNEPLRFLAEEGVIVGLLLSLFIASFVFPFQKLKKVSEKCPESIAVLIFFISQALFQYPLSQPFPLFLIPFVLAYTVHFTNEKTSFSVPFLHSVNRVLGVYCGLFSVMLGLTFYISINHQHHMSLNKTIYFFWKDEKILKNILFTTYLSRDYYETKEYALKALAKDPQNLIPLKYLGLVALFENDTVNGCSYLKKYDAAYGHLSSVHDKVTKYCEELEEVKK